jgi:hypothetical protein
MAHPTEQELATLRRLAQAPEGRLLVRVLQDRLVETDKTNRRAIGESLIRGQGRAQEIEDLLDLLGFTEARPIAPQVKHPTRPPVERYRTNHMAVD